MFNKTAPQNKRIEAISLVLIFTLQTLFIIQKEVVSGIQLDLFFNYKNNLLV